MNLHDVLLAPIFVTIVHNGNDKIFIIVFKRLLCSIKHLSVHNLLHFHLFPLPFPGPSSFCESIYEAE